MTSPLDFLYISISFLMQDSIKVTAEFATGEENDVFGDMVISVDSKEGPFEYNDTDKNYSASVLIKQDPAVRSLAGSEIKKVSIKSDAAKISIDYIMDKDLTACSKDGKVLTKYDISKSSPASIELSCLKDFDGGKIEWSFVNIPEEGEASEGGDNTNELSVAGGKNDY